MGGIWHAEILGWPEDVEKLTWNQSETPEFGNAFPRDTCFPKIVFILWAEDYVLWF